MYLKKQVSIENFRKSDTNNLHKKLQYGDKSTQIDRQIYGQMGRQT